MFDRLRRRARAQEARESPPATAATPREAPDATALAARVVEALKTIYDPEIPVNIHDLGLIYGLDLDSAGRVHVRMTLTAPGCPVAQSFPGTVEAAVRAVEGVSEASVELVWDPPWSPERMSDEARLELGML